MAEAHTAPTTEPGAIERLALAVLKAAQRRRDLKRRGYASRGRVESLAAVAESGARLLLETLEGRS